MFWRCLINEKDIKSIESRLLKQIENVEEKTKKKNQVHSTMCLNCSRRQLKVDFNNQ